MDFLIAAALGNDPVLSEPDSTPSSPKSEVLSPGSAQERIKTLQLLMALALPRPHSFDDDDETHADDVAWDFKATPSLPLRSASASASNGSGAPIQTSSVFKCEAGTCSTTCPTSELLADHLNKRHRDATVLFMNAAEEKVVPRDANGLLTCFCGHRPFTYLNGLLKHAKTCSGAKPPPPAIDPAATAAKTFKCAFEGCGKSYNSKTGLTLHVKTKHAIASPAAADSPAASGEIKTEAGSDEKPIVETQGNQDVGSSLSVSTAARTAATTSTPSPITSIPPPNLSFKCDAEKCIQAFATKKGLALHKSKSHGDATVLFLGSTVPIIIRRKDGFLFCPCGKAKKITCSEMNKHAAVCTGILVPLASSLEPPSANNTPQATESSTPPPSDADSCAPISGVKRAFPEVSLPGTPVSPAVAGPSVVDDGRGDAGAAKRSRLGESISSSD